jgi:hypothetical protein
MLLVAMFNAVRRCETCHPAGNRHHRRICNSKPDAAAVVVFAPAIKKRSVRKTEKDCANKNAG